MTKSSNKTTRGLACKRGIASSDFTIVFIRYSDESNHRTVKCTKGIPWYAFSE